MFIIPNFLFSKIVDSNYIHGLFNITFLDLKS